MVAILVRKAHSNGAFAVGLFLLSCLLAVPASRWAFAPPAEPSESREFVFSSAAPATMPPEVSAAIAKDLKLRAWHTIPELNVEIAQFATVFWEPRDTDSLRARISNSSTMQGAKVLEIGTGTGLIAICCALNGAEVVVATDINPNAYANAQYNAEHLKLGARIECRLVESDTPGPYTAVHANERFDFIISNPPWEDALVEEVSAHALYDPNFELLDAILTESAARLRPGGTVLLAYGARTAITRILEKAPQHGWKATVDDHRDLSELPEVFVPAMLIELVQN